MRTLAGVMLLTLGGCNCLQPVAEGLPDGGGRDGGGSDAGLDAGRPDGGTDAGPDAGPYDGGPIVACTTAAQCVGALPAQSLCSFGTDAGFSCIDQRCVFECSRDRTCTFDAGAACLDCAAAVPACIESFCGAAVIQGDVESTTASCQLGFTAVMLTPTGGCQWTVSDASGARGVITRVGGTGGYVGRFPGLGTCVGVSLQTQVERVLFSCEGCQFTLRI